jgi:photosystem II stability/assembly factor-like uncharacterized protein
MRPLTLFALAVVFAGWTPQSSGTTGELRGLSVVDANVIWASGVRGTVTRTTDGGNTWRADTVSGARTLDFRDIAAIDGKTAFAVSAGEAERGLAKIYKTTDAGATWALSYSAADTGVFFDAISFWNDRSGIVMSDPVGGKLVLLRTDDAGATWTRIPAASLPPTLPGEAAFAASGTSVAVQGSSNVWIGSGGAATARVFRSTDRGLTWTVADTPIPSSASAGIFSVAFADASNGVVVGGDYTKARVPSPNVALTNDGGRTWRLARGPLPQGFMSCVAYLPNTNGRSLIAVGLGGTALSTDGGESWTMADTLGYNSVAVAPNGTAWAIGPRGRVAVWKQ